MKAFITAAAAAAILTACGGGGGGDTATNPRAQCTYPTTPAAPQAITGTGGNQAITDTTKKLTLSISGTGNTVTLGPCVNVGALTITGSGHTLKTDASTQLDTLNMDADSVGTSARIPKASNTRVTDQGTGNTVATY